MYKIVMTFGCAPQVRLDNAEKTAKKIEGELYIGTTCTVHNFRDIIKKAKRTGENLVLLEDDVIPCKNFTERVQEAVKDKPNTLTRLFRYSPVCGFLPFNKYVNMQCVYIPKKYYDPILEKIDYVIENRYDLVKRNDYEKILTYLPGFFYTTEVNYVKAFKTPSTIFKDFTDPESFMFIDDL